MSDTQIDDVIDGQVETEHDQLTRLKKAYLEYYRDLPVQKLAAASIGRTDDTIIAWRKADPTFAEDIQRAKAAWALKRVKRVDDAWLLERILREEFSPRVEVAVIPGQEKTLEQLIADARERGIDTSAYERLIAPPEPAAPATEPPDRPGETGVAGEDPISGSAQPESDGSASQG